MVEAAFSRVNANSNHVVARNGASMVTGTSVASRPTTLWNMFQTGSETFGYPICGYQWLANLTVEERGSRGAWIIRG
jgi:hypothetical protein